MKNEEKSTQYITRKSLFNSFNLVWNYSKKYMILNTLFAFLQGVLPALLIIVMQQIINMLQKGANDFGNILILILIYVILNILTVSSTSLFSLYNNQFTLEFSQYLNLKMLNKAAELKLKDYENSETYNTINRAQNQNGASVLTLVSQILEIVKQSVTILSTVIILFKFRWWIFILILIIPFMRCSFTIKLNQKWYKLRIERTGEERQVWYINFLMLTGNAFKEIKILGIKQYLIQKYKNIQTKIIQQDKTMYMKITFLNISMDIVEWLITGALFVFTIFQGFLGKILIGDVTAYTDCIYNIETNVQNIFMGIEEISEKAMYIELLFTFLNMPVTREGEGISIAKIEKIELKNLSFKYVNGNYALKNINMIIDAKSRVAFVGKNGSGKTTLAKIILGLYDNYEGEIYINDINMKNIDMRQYRNKFGCVFQDYVKYETTIKENIALGNLEKMDDEEALKRVIEAVKLNHRIEEGGLDAVVGYWFGEQQLSIGEWQRIAIARALIKDADVYVFDEPDASLDILKQKELIDTYSEILKNKIGIYISHKINYVHLVASYIYVLENGEVIEKGTHSQLLENKGLYNSMYAQCEIE